MAAVTLLLKKPTFPCRTNPAVFSLLQASVRIETRRIGEHFQRGRRPRSPRSTTGTPIEGAAPIAAPARNEKQEEIFSACRIRRQPIEKLGPWREMRLGFPSAGFGFPSTWLGFPSDWLGFPSDWLGFPSGGLEILHRVRGAQSLHGERGSPQNGLAYAAP
jgi:hypothetical protein